MADPRVVNQLVNIITDEYIKAKVESHEWKKFVRRSAKHEKALSAVLRSYFVKQEKKVLAALAKYSKAISFPFLEKSFISKQKDELSRIIFPLIKRAVNEEGIVGIEELQARVSTILDGFVLDADVRKTIQQMVNVASTEITETTFKRMLVQYDTGVEAGESFADIKERISGVFKDAVASRVSAIARTETIKAMNAGRLLAYESSGVVDYVRFYTAKDERRCETCASYHDKVFPINSSKRPEIPAHPNCRCTWLPEVNPEYLKSWTDVYKYIVQKSYLFVTCDKCKTKFDYLSLPESGMGYVKCPTCGNAVTQEQKTNKIDSRTWEGSSNSIKAIGLSAIFKMGTARSGNRGHAGRPGKVGGSSVAYHGTVEEYANGIMKTGLKGNKLRKLSANYVYASPDFSLAVAYALTNDKYKYSSPVVVTVDKSKFKEEADTNGQVLSSKVNVSASAIKRIDIYDRSALQKWYNAFDDAKTSGEKAPRPPKPIKTLTKNKKNADDELYIVILFLQTENKELGLSLFFKMGMPGRSGNFGHEGRPGKVGGSVSNRRKGGKANVVRSAGQRAIDQARDAKKAQELGLTAVRKYENGKLHLSNGKVIDLPEHLQAKNLMPAGITPGLEDIYVNLNERSVANGAYAVRARSTTTGEIKGCYSKQASGESTDTMWKKISQLEKDEPRLTRKIQKDMKGEWGEHATCLRLIQLTAIRAGDDNTVKHGVYGATTLLGKHATITKDGVTFNFIGKESVPHTIYLKDKSLAADIARRKKKTGENGYLFDVTYHGKEGLLEYTKQLSKNKYTPKNFRTLRATQWALQEMKKYKQPKTKSAYAEYVKSVSGVVGKKLGHASNKGEPWKMAFNEYINPRVFITWNKGNWNVGKK